MNSNIKVLVLISVFLASTIAANSQKIGGFYQKNYNFSYPSNPLPFGVLGFEVVDNVKTKGIKAYDGRNELVNIIALNPKLVQYSNDYNISIGRLNAFIEHKKANSGPDAVNFVLNSSDIIISHSQSEIDSIYTINAKAKAYYQASHNGKIIYQDSIFYDDKVSEIVSELSPSRFNEQAINLYESITIDANNKVLAQFYNAYHRFVKKIDMGYYKGDVPFFKMKKTKKFENPKKPLELEKSITALTSVDKGFDSREERNKKIKSIISNFENEINNGNYKNHDNYKAFVYGNLGSLYSLLEDFDTAIKHYEKAKSLIVKSGPKTYAQRGIRDAERRKKLKNKIIRDQKVLKEFADNYNNILTKGSKI